jgi:predicted XRE-type DNA-binding protein
MNNYYIYIYLDSRSPGKYCYENFSFLYKPIYVGKGKNNRWKKINKYDRSDYFINKINKIKKSGLEPIVIKLYENLNEKESLKKEVELISEIEIANPGILVNMTSGGDGVSGYKFLKETIETISKKRRKNYQDIKKEFEKRNYKLLTTEDEYKNKNTKLKYICTNGHEGFMSWDHFQRGNGCFVCGYKLSSKKRRKNFQDIKNEFEKRNYRLLTEENEYKNSQQKLKYICPNGHECLISWNNFQHGYGCPICFNKSLSEKMKGKNSILIIQDIIQIKLLLKEGKLIQQEIADIFGVDQMTISKIKTRKTWSYIEI